MRAAARRRRCGPSACTTWCARTKRPPRVVSGGGAEPIDLGHVGDVDGFDLPLLERARSTAATLPVVACLGHDGDGAVYNINADIVANQLAGALRRRRAGAGHRRARRAARHQRSGDAHPAPHRRRGPPRHRRRHRLGRHDPQARGVVRRARARRARHLHRRRRGRPRASASPAPSAPCWWPTDPAQSRARLAPRARDRLGRAPLPRRVCVAADPRALRSPHPRMGRAGHGVARLALARQRPVHRRPGGRSGRALRPESAGKPSTGSARW